MKSITLAECLPRGSQKKAAKPHQENPVFALGVSGDDLDVAGPLTPARHTPASVERHKPQEEVARNRRAVAVRHTPSAERARCPQ
jgi:hypothetical protein